MTIDEVKELLRKFVNDAMLDTAAEFELVDIKEFYFKLIDKLSRLIEELEADDDEKARG